MQRKQRRPKLKGVPSSEHFTVSLLLARHDVRVLSGEGWPVNGSDRRVSSASCELKSAEMCWVSEAMRRRLQRLRVRGGARVPTVHQLQYSTWLDKWKLSLV